MLKIIILIYVNVQVQIWAKIHIIISEQEYISHTSENMFLVYNHNSYNISYNNATNIK